VRKSPPTLAARLGAGTAAAVLSLAALAEGPADVKGWGKVTWGMTLDQVRKLYPDAKPYQPKSEMERKSLEASDETALEIPAVALFGTKFEVNFVGHGPKKEIAFVEIYSRVSVTEKTFQELEKDLTLKHGEPAHKGENGGWTERVWTLPSTKVELWYHGTLEKEQPAIGFSYSPLVRPPSGKP
jgi:hypothetical protein